MPVARAAVAEEEEAAALAAQVEEPAAEVAWAAEPGSHPQPAGNPPLAAAARGLGAPAEACLRPEPVDLVVAAVSEARGSPVPVLVDLTALAEQEPDPAQ